MLDYFQNLIANCASKWRPVVGYEGLYEVSMDGQVKSLKRPGFGTHKSREVKEKIRKTPISKRLGYPMVVLNKNGSGKMFYVHRLVASAHIGEIHKGAEVDHKNGDRADNRVENLRIVTKSQNVRNKVSTRSVHGHRGVEFVERNGIRKWAARINNRRIGSFLTKEEAIAARIKAEREIWGADAPSEVRK